MEKLPKEIQAIREGIARSEKEEVEKVFVEWFYVASAITGDGTVKEIIPKKNNVFYYAKSNTNRSSVYLELEELNYASLRTYADATHSFFDRIYTDYTGVVHTAVYGWKFIIDR